MITINKPDNEKERLKSLRSYQILDSIPEIDFDDITLLATQICKTSIAYISLIDDERQWFKSTKGFNVKESPRSSSICAYAINYPTEILVIPNLLDDDRFYDHPIAIGPAQIRFYASIPLVNPDGYALGTICVLDKKERKLTAKQADAMKSLSRQVMNALEIRKYQAALKKNNDVLKAKTGRYEIFAFETLDIISSPLNSIGMLTNLLKKYIAEGDKSKASEYADMIDNAALNVVSKIEELKKTHSYMSIISMPKTKVDFTELIKKIIENESVLKQKSEIKLPIQTEVFFENEYLLSKIIADTLKLIIAVNQKEVTNFNFVIDKTKEDYIIKIVDDSSRSIDLDDEKNSTLEFINTTTTASKWTYKITYNNGIGHLMKLIIPR